MANVEKLLCKENNDTEKQLTKENNLLLTDMIVYLHSGNLCEYDVQIMRKELLGMALEAQLRQEDFKDVIGEDYKFFCDELMESGRQKTKYEKGLELLYILVFGIGFGFLYNVFSHVMIQGVIYKSHDNLFKMPITVGDIASSICSVILAYAIYYFVSKNSFELNCKKVRITFVCVFTIVFLLGIFAYYTLDSITLYTVNFIYPTILLLGLFLGIKWLNDRHANSLAKTHK